jgi:hypothetical protein
MHYRALVIRECHRLFPDEMFADLFCDVDRRACRR